MRSTVYTAICEAQGQFGSPRHQIEPDELGQTPKEGHRRKPDDLCSDQRSAADFFLRLEKQRPARRPQPVSQPDHGHAQRNAFPIDVLQLIAENGPLEMDMPTHPQRQDQKQRRSHQIDNPLIPFQAALQFETSFGDSGNRRG